MKNNNNLHCGACMENFDDGKELSCHLKHCPAALVLLPLIHILWFSGDAVGHPTSHFIQCLNENASLIKQYITCVVNRLDILKRAELHSKLCKKLGFKYDDFRPFESSDIKEWPTEKEAEWIFWLEIEKKLWKKRGGKKT